MKPIKVTRRRFVHLCTAGTILPSFFPAKGESLSGLRGVKQVSATILRTKRRDPFQPVYHFHPPANWMNDTMGVYWKGKYHIFYLYNPDGPVWRQDKQWAHAESNDLVHWKYLPHALGPLLAGPEKLCCQTGSLTTHTSVPTAFYTCAPGVCMATSNDDLRVWQRYPQNPVIAGPPPGLRVLGFRDPFVFERGGTWYMLMASGVRSSGGTILLYESHDSISWKYVHPLLHGLGNSDRVWEVPELFRLGTKDVLTYSASRHTYYFIGSYRDRRFDPERRGQMDLGDYFYAATSFLDDSHRRIMIAWIKEGRSKEAVLRAGWSGILSIPRILSLGEEGQIEMEPVPEINELRGVRRLVSNLRVASGSDSVISGLRGNTLDIIAEFDPGSAMRFGLKVLRSPAGDEHTAIYYDRQDSRFVMDTTRSSQSTDVEKKVLSGPLVCPVGKPLRFRVLIDRSVIEAFAGGTAAITGRVYPMLPSSDGVTAFAEGGTASLRFIAAWQMKPIW